MTTCVYYKNAWCGRGYGSDRLSSRSSVYNFIWRYTFRIVSTTLSTVGTIREYCYYCPKNSNRLAPLIPCVDARSHPKREREKLEKKASEHYHSRQCWRMVLRRGGNVLRLEASKNVIVEQEATLRRPQGQAAAGTGPHCCEQPDSPPAPVGLRFGGFGPAGLGCAGGACCAGICIAGAKACCCWPGCGSCAFICGAKPG